MSAPPAPTAIPDDVRDTRAAHRRRILGHPHTRTLGALLIVSAAVGGSVGGGPALALAAAGTVLVVGLAGIWLVARALARQDFFRAYTHDRGLALRDGRGSLPAITPLLRRGDERYTELEMAGSLPGDLDGTLALYTCEEESGSGSDRHATYHHFTLVYAELPQLAPMVEQLLCQRRSGFRFLDSAEDVFRRAQRVELESEALERRYEIFAGEGDDPNLVRQIFEPSFIVWLVEAAPDDFAFELVAGVLVASVSRRLSTAAELDALCNAAAAVARRLRDEAAE